MPDISNFKDTAGNILKYLYVGGQKRKLKAITDSTGTVYISTAPLYNGGTQVTRDALRTMVVDKDFAGLSSANVSAVTDMSYLFKPGYEASAGYSDTRSGTQWTEAEWNQVDFSGWDTRSVTTVKDMFNDCINLNKEISFDLPQCVVLTSMFYGCTNLTVAPKLTNTSLVEDTGWMFAFCTSLDDAIILDTSNVTFMRAMFRNCNNMNSPITINTSKCTNMREMFFECSVFDQQLDFFDTSNVTSMGSMFIRCFAFTQDISNWNVSLIPTKPSTFDSDVSTVTWPDIYKPVWGTDGT